MFLAVKHIFLQSYFSFISWNPVHWQHSGIKFMMVFPSWKLVRIALTRQNCYTNTELHLLPFRSYKSSWNHQFFCDPCSHSSLSLLSSMLLASYSIRGAQIIVYFGGWRTVLHRGGVHEEPLLETLDAQGELNLSLQAWRAIIQLP